MSNYRLEVKLRQYTPLLHFQGAEEGACLRASEVKPKLDKFVLDYLEQHKKVPVPNGWKIPENKQKVDSDGIIYPPALRYKMRFEVHGNIEPIYDELNSQKKVIKHTHSLYFGSLGDEDSGIWDKNGISRMRSIFYPYDSNHSIQMTIVCVNNLEKISLNNEMKTFLQLLSELLPVFFAINGFGNRSNKGFGSFGVVAINGKPLTQTVTLQEIKKFTPCNSLFYAFYPSIQSPQKYLNDVKALSDVMKKEVKQYIVNSTNRIENLAEIERIEGPIRFKAFGQWLLVIPQKLPAVLLRSNLQFKKSKEPLARQITSLIVQQEVTSISFIQIMLKDRRDVFPKLIECQRRR